MEIEIPRVQRSFTNYVNNLSPIRFAASDDGSIRQACYSVDGIPIVPTSRLYEIPSAMAENYGLELVSSPYPVDVWRKQAKKLSDVIGIIPPYGNSSIHVHMDIGNKPWKFIQELCGWFYALESVWYRLSGLGIRHRGEANSYKYMRPLSCPIHWVDEDAEPDDDDDDDNNRLSTRRRRERSGEYVPVINTLGLLNAKNASQFFAAYGRLDQRWGNIDHYCPQRLHGINIVSAMRQGTAELRIFNGVYRHLPTIIDICDKFYSLAERESFRMIDKPYVLGVNPDDDMAKMILFDLLQLEQSKELKDIWEATKWCKPPAVRNLIHHYRGWPKPEDTMVRQICTIGGAGSSDSGHDSFVPFVRR